MGQNVIRHRGQHMDVRPLGVSAVRSRTLREGVVELGICYASSVPHLGVGVPGGDPRAQSRVKVCLLLAVDEVGVTVNWVHELAGGGATHSRVEVQPS